MEAREHLVYLIVEANATQVEFILIIYIFLFLFFYLLLYFFPCWCLAIQKVTTFSTLPIQSVCLRAERFNVFKTSVQIGHAFYKVLDCSKLANLDQLTITFVLQVYQLSIVWLVLILFLSRLNLCHLALDSIPVFTLIQGEHDNHSGPSEESVKQFLLQAVCQDWNITQDSTHA